MSLAYELERLERYRSSGLLTAQEFEKEKAELLRRWQQNAPPAEQPANYGAASTSWPGSGTWSGNSAASSASASSGNQPPAPQPGPTAEGYAQGGYQSGQQGNPYAAPAGGSSSDAWQPYHDPYRIERETNTWGSYLHLSLLSTLIFSFAGLAAPFIIWAIKRDELPGINAHGRRAANWLISQFLYTVGFFVVFMMGAVAEEIALVIAGLLLIGIVSICGLIFPIVAGIKASNGKVWDYPLAIRFFR